MQYAPKIHELSYFEDKSAIATPAKETMFGVKYFATSVYTTVK